MPLRNLQIAQEDIETRSAHLYLDVDRNGPPPPTLAVRLALRIPASSPRPNYVLRLLPTKYKSVGSGRIRSRARCNASGDGGEVGGYPAARIPLGLTFTKFLNRSMKRTLLRARAEALQFTIAKTSLRTAHLMTLAR